MATQQDRSDLLKRVKSSLNTYYLNESKERRMDREKTIVQKQSSKAENDLEKWKKK